MRFLSVYEKEKFQEMYNFIIEIFKILKFFIFAIGKWDCNFPF